MILPMRWWHCGRFCWPARPQHIAAKQEKRIWAVHHRAMPLDLDALRRHAVARTLFAPTTLPRAIEQPGLRAGRPDPRAGARAGPDAAPPRRATTAPATWSAATRGWPIEEDFFVNYGFLPRATARADAPAHGAHGMAEVALGAGRTRCWTSCASAAWCTRARSTRTSRTARRATGSAARPTPARSCSTACTTAACCAWRGARAACACTPRATRTSANAAEADAALDALVDVVVGQVRAAAGGDARASS